MAKVTVGLSGGVDSAVAAFLLKEQGHEVSALFMQNWHGTEGLLEGQCHWEDDYDFARLVARHLDIPLRLVDLSGEYMARVADYMFDEYEKGRTPNPDVLCNREIKWDVFLKEALKDGAEFVATGHYCRKGERISQNGKTEYALLAGKDPNKDQSYFLCQLNQDMLKYALFPIGDIEKPEVRKIAEEQKLPNYNKKDSQGLCFIGKVDLPTFLMQKLAAKEGDIIEVQKNAKEQLPPPPQDPDEEELKLYTSPVALTPEMGKKLATHQGAHFYTVGQRKGLRVGGTAEPLFVVGTDVESNIVYTGQTETHFALNRWGLFVRADEAHWVRPSQQMKPGEQRGYKARIRYRQKPGECTLYMREEGLYIIFDELQRGVAPGQFVAWYDGEELAGSGVIS